jgi:hypothetical protein
MKGVRILIFLSSPRVPSPFSFQQLTSAQSPISPLNPIFLPFVEIKMRISLPSNNITSDNTQGKRVPTRFNSLGEPQATGFVG